MYLQDRLALDGKARLTRRGYLTATARVARSGVQDYLGSEVGKDPSGVVRDGIVKVYRPDDQVFSRDAMQTYAHLPITVGHPAQLVDGTNWKQVAVGHTGEDVVRDGETVKVSMLVMDSAAAQALAGGQGQFSMGYEMELDWTPGTTPQGVAYDARQTKLSMNHVAIVDQARGGSQLVVDEKGDRDMPGSNKTVMVDGIPVDATDASAAVIETLQKRLAAKDAEIADMQGKMTKAEKEKAEADAKVSVMEKAAKDSAITPEKLNAMVADRDQVRATFKAITGADADPKLSTDGIKKAAVTKYLGDEAPTTDDGINAAFATMAKNRQPANDGLRTALTDGVQIMDHSAVANDALFASAGVKMKKGA